MSPVEIHLPTGGSPPTYPSPMLSERSLASNCASLVGGETASTEGTSEISVSGKNCQAKRPGENGLTSTLGAPHHHRRQQLPRHRPQREPLVPMPEGAPHARHRGHGAEHGLISGMQYLCPSESNRRTAFGSRTQLLEFHDPRAHGSELVPIGVAHVGDIEVLAVVGTQARRSFGLTALRKRGGVERLHFEPGASLQCHHHSVARGRVSLVERRADPSGKFCQPAVLVGRAIGAGIRIAPPLDAELYQQRSSHEQIRTQGVGEG